MKKHLLALVLLLAVTTAGWGQFYKALLPSPQFTRAIEAIVLDFRLDYRNIQGTLIDSLGDFSSYTSAVQIPGASECRILRFNSAMDTTACWQAVVYVGDNYKEAVRAYENTVRLLKKSNIHWIDRSVVKFTGELIAPRADMRFTTSTLLLRLDDYRYRDFIAEVELLATDLDRWEVQLNIGKKPDIFPETHLQ